MLKVSPPCTKYDLEDEASEMLFFLAGHAEYVLRGTASETIQNTAIRSLLSPYRSDILSYLIVSQLQEFPC